MSALTAAHVERFAADGFVLVENVLDDDALERFGAAVDEGVRERSAGDTRSLVEKSLYEQSFTQCMNLWEDCEGVRPLTFDPRLGEMAARLLGVDGVRVWHDQALYKESGGRETDPHQDWPFWPIRPTDQVTAWIPFDSSSREGGGMAYLPGSHRVGLRRFVDISHTLEPEPYAILEDPAVAAIEPVWVDAPAGSVVFHHSLTVHLAAPNTSEALRRAFCVIYFADGCTRRSAFPNPAVDRQGIAVGEPVRGELTPLAWPRAEGDLPTPPPSRGPRTGFR